MTYDIIVRERYAEYYSGLCRVSSNPRAVVDRLEKKKLRVDVYGNGRLFDVPRYVTVIMKKVEEGEHD